MNWFSLSLLCAFSLASADTLTKWRLADYSEEELVLARLVVPAALLSPILLYHPLPYLPLQFWMWIAGAIPLEIVAMLLYMQAIKHSPLYLTLPYLAFTPIFTALTGYFLLGERIGITGISGIALITAGAFLLNVRHIGKGILEPFKAILREKGSRMMMAVALIYGLTSVLVKGALQYCPPITFGAFYYLLVGTASLLYFMSKNHGIPASIFRKPQWVLAAALLSMVMALSHFLALDATKAAYMIAVKRTSLLFGVIFGAILFGEKDFRLHFLAGVIMVAGVALISTMV